MKLHSIWNGWPTVLYIDTWRNNLFSFNVLCQNERWTLDRKFSEFSIIRLFRSIATGSLQKTVEWSEKKNLSLSNLLFSSYYTQVRDDNSHQLVIIMYLATRNVESEFNRLVISTGSRMKFPETTSASLDGHFRRYTHDPRTHLRQTVPPDEEDRNRDRESARNPEEYTEDLVAYHYK